MSEVKVGDKVRITWGTHIGKVGIVEEVGLTERDGEFPNLMVGVPEGEPFLAYSDGVEPISDSEYDALVDHPYEYAMQVRSWSSDKWVETSDPMIRETRLSIVWADRKSREYLVDWCNKEFGTGQYRLVRRLKAGKVEVVE